MHALRVYYFKLHALICDEFVKPLPVSVKQEGQQKTSLRMLCGTQRLKRLYHVTLRTVMLVNKGDDADLSIVAVYPFTVRKDMLALFKIKRFRKSVRVR